MEEAKKRKEIYDFLANLGLKLRYEAQRDFKKLLISYVKLRTDLLLNDKIQPVITNPPKRQYLFICKDCRFKKFIEGKKAKKQIIGRNPNNAKIEEIPFNDDDWEKNLVKE